MYIGRPVVSGGMSSNVGGGSSLTDNDGRFMHAVTGGDLQVSVQVAGYKSQSTKLNVPPGETRSGVRLIMAKGHYLAGRVTRANGTPVVRELISASGPPNYQNSTSMTDSNGRYRLDNIEAPIVNVNVGTSTNRENFSNVATDRENADFVVGTKTQITLVGKVVDFDTLQPIPSFQIKNSDGARPEGLIQSDPQRPGFFRISGLSGDSYLQLTLSAEGYQQLDATLQSFLPTNIATGEMEKTFKLGRGASVIGKLLIRADNRPMADTRVDVTYGYLGATSVASAITDSDGSFRLDKLPGRKLTFQFLPPAPYTQISKEVQCKFGEPLDLGIILVGGPGTIAGRVTRVADDVGLAGQKVSVSQGNTVKLEKDTDSNGYFEFAELSPGDYTVMQNSSKAARGVTVKPDTLHEVNFKTGGSRLHGTVLRNHTGVLSKLTFTHKTSDLSLIHI